MRSLHEGTQLRIIDKRDALPWQWIFRLNSSAISCLACTCVSLRWLALNRPRSIYQYSYMAPRLLGLSSFLCPSIPKRYLDTKKTTPNIEVWPESLGAVLEYWYIERGLFGRDQICTQVKASFSQFGHPTQVNASWVTPINLLLPIRKQS